MEYQGRSGQITIRDTDDPDGEIKLNFQETDIVRTAFIVDEDILVFPATPKSVGTKVAFTFVRSLRPPKSRKKRAMKKWRNRCAKFFDQAMKG